MKRPPANSIALSREAELLCTCVGVARDASLRSRVRAPLESELDWTFLLQCAASNRVLGLLHRGLRMGAPELVPQEARQVLEAHDQRTRFRNLHHLHELLALVQELEARGIEVLPYKGPALGATLYEDLALREYSDLDVIVHTEDLPEVRSFLLRRGYEALESLTPAAERAYLRSDCELHFRHPRTGVLLEVHWEVLPRRHAFGFHVGDLWERLVPVALSGVTCLSFAPEDLLLVLCVHGGEKHGWMRLQMLADVARLLERHPELDWALLWQRAAAVGRTRTVELGLFLARTLLDAPLPQRQLERVLGRRWVRVHAALTRGKPFREDSGLPGFAEWQANQVDLLLRAGVPEPRADGRLAYLLGILRPEWNDRQSLGLPAWLSWVHYLYRPVRLFRLHRAGLFKRLRTTPVSTE